MGYNNRCRQDGDCLSTAGWSSLAARRAHNPKVVGSNPTPATMRRHSSVGQSIRFIPEVSCVRITLPLPKNPAKFFAWLVFFYGNPLAEHRPRAQSRRISGISLGTLRHLAGLFHRVCAQIHQEAKRAAGRRRPSACYPLKKEKEIGKWILTIFPWNPPFFPSYESPEAESPEACRDQAAGRCSPYGAHNRSRRSKGKGIHHARPEPLDTAFSPIAEWTYRAPDARRRFPDASTPHIHPTVIRGWRIPEHNHSGYTLPWNRNLRAARGIGGSTFPSQAECRPSQSACRRGFLPHAGRFS